MKKLDLIFDTDVGSDCDDMMALAYLIYAKRNLNVSIKAITHCNGCVDGIPTIRAMFRHLGEECAPVGSVAVPSEAYDDYAKQVAERFADTSDRQEAPNAVSVLRRALCNSEEAVICAVGPFTNIAALLTSKGDEISKLDGVELVRKKCKRIVIMGGRFDVREPEWNARADAPATKTMVALCPVPIVFVPFEAGYNMITGGPLMDTYGQSTPLTMSFFLHSGVIEKGGQHSWDPITAVYAIEGCLDFFEESDACTVTVEDDGTTVVSGKGGMHTIISIKNHSGLTEQQCKDRIASYLDSCAVKVYLESFENKK